MESTPMLRLHWTAEGRDEHGTPQRRLRVPPDGHRCTLGRRPHDPVSQRADALEDVDMAVVLAPRQPELDGGVGSLHALRVARAASVPQTILRRPSDVSRRRPPARDPAQTRLGTLPVNVKSARITLCPRSAVGSNMHGQPPSMTVMPCSRPKAVAVADTLPRPGPRFGEQGRRATPYSWLLVPLVPPSGSAGAQASDTG